jgi:hypothetical protein
MRYIDNVAFFCRSSKLGLTLKATSTMMRLLRLFVSWPAALVLWITVVSLVSMELWGLRLFGVRFDYLRAGTLGQWIAALMSFAAVSVALWGNYLSQIRYETDKREKDDDELSDLSAWTEICVEAESSSYWAVVFWNRTSYPIYAWDLAIEGAPTLNSSVLGPLIPGENRFRLNSEISTQQRISLPCRFTFTDRKGRIWRVDTLGNKELCHE